MNPNNPTLPYDRHWPEYARRKVDQKWEVLRDTTHTYEDETLKMETLGDDYQQLFVTMVLDHVQHVIT